MGGFDMPILVTLFMLSVGIQRLTSMYDFIVTPRLTLLVWTGLAWALAGPCLLTR